MKLKIFNASLKPSKESNTQALVDLVTKNMNSLGVTVDTVHLKELNFELITRFRILLSRVILSMIVIF